MVDALANVTPTALVPASGTAAAAAPTVWGKNGFTFFDLLDIVNPLQQLPIVGTLYRAITGDEISAVARLAGGALFGGPLGLAAAGVDTAVEMASGQDIGSTLMSAFKSATESDPTKLTIAGMNATKLENDSNSWFSLFSSLAPEPKQALHISSQKKASSAYENAAKLVAA